MEKYCDLIYSTKRRQTRSVMVGNVGVGGDNPVRIQSMTTSSTRDVEATVNQIKRLADAGCEIARVTVQGIKEADACEQIKNQLIQSGYSIPVVADIHFYPPAAMRVVDFVDKVRINPGNFVDKRATFKVLTYDDASYQEELNKIEEKFTPLVEKCKKLKRAMRIGTNHGSLSDRIMNRYGDSPKGMLESALEFARICRKNDYHDFIFSMKSSNPQVMIQAYRLLAQEMYRLDWDYPLHLGVTEAGQGEDGRIKSAMGIGALLLDGIGDTIRVSLTEDAWNEIDPCQRLINFVKQYSDYNGEPFVERNRQIEEFKRRPVFFSQDVALHRDGTVIVSAKNSDALKNDFYSQVGCDLKLGKPKLKAASADSIVMWETPLTQSYPIIRELNIAGLGILSLRSLDGVTQIKSLSDVKVVAGNPFAPERFAVGFQQNSSPRAVLVKDEPKDQWSKLEEIDPSVIFFSPSEDKLHKARDFFEWLQERKLRIPVILNFKYTCSKDDLIIQAAAECGALLCDGLGEGICLEGDYEISFLRELSFGILQAARMRSSKTDFISCPSCGRTLFDLQDVTKRIKERTAHLPGVKIAIMGCIVNGPGEMADADFGYVGSKPGMIDLYVGKECVEKDISFSEADDRLVTLIKAHGRWLEPELVEV